MKKLSLNEMEQIQGGGTLGCVAGWVAVGAVATVAAVAVFGTGGLAAAAGALLVGKAGFGTAVIFATGASAVVDNCK
jgi:hypothetical protein